MGGGKEESFLPQASKDSSVLFARKDAPERLNLVERFSEGVNWMSSSSSSFVAH